MKPDAEAYLRKALENLASSEADLAAGRHNAAASRAYYSSFQAAVAALIDNGIRPRGDEWEHRFVISQFSGKLIRRRKVMRARFMGTLDRLLKTRLVADYRPASVSQRDAKESVCETTLFVEVVRAQLEERNHGD